MIDDAFRQDRLCVLHVGEQRLAVPLGEVRRFASALELRPVTGAAPWVAGLLGDRATGAWIPVIDLARLWDDPALAGQWTHMVVTNVGLAIGVDGYDTTPTAHPLFDLRPAPGNAAVGRAALLAARPIPVLSTHHLVPAQEWQALAATA